MKIFIRISFLGTTFYGTQKQSDKKTIQGDFESLLSRLYNEKVKVTISSRLDRGVHALDFALSFDAPHDNVSLNHLEYYLRRSVSKDIFIKEVRKVDDEFSPRYSCKDKTYLYLIQNGENKNPLLNPFTYTPKHPLNIEKMKACLSLFKGLHDFRAFASPEGEEKTLLIIDNVSIEEKNHLLRIRFSSKAFLRYQVRFMVGACIYVAEGKLSLDEVKNALDNGKELHTRYKAEPQGLILEHINYPQIVENITNEPVLLF